MELFRYHIYIAIVLTSSIGLTTRICLAQETAGQETRGVNSVKKSGEKSRRHAISSVNIMMEKAMLFYTLWDILDNSFYDASPTQPPDTSEHSISKMQEQDVISLHNSARQKTTSKLPLKPRTGMVRKEVFTSKGQDQVSSAYKTLSDPTATTNTLVPFMQHTLKSFNVFTGSQFPPKASTREVEPLEVTKSIDISVKSTSDLSLHTEVNSVNSSNSLLPHLWDSTIKTRILDHTASKILITPSTVQRAKNIMSNEPILDEHASVVEISLGSTSSDNSLTKSTYPTPVSEIQDKYVHYTITTENSTHNLSAKALKMSTKTSISNSEKRISVQKTTPKIKELPSTQRAKRAKDNTRGPHEGKISEKQETSLSIWSYILSLTLAPMQTPHTPNPLTETHSPILSTTSALSRETSKKKDSPTPQTSPVILFSTITSRLQTEASVLKGLMKLTESDILASTRGATRSPPANNVAKHLIAVPVTRPTSTPPLFRIYNILDAQNIMHTSTTVDEKSQILFPTNVIEHLRSELFTTPHTSSGATNTASIRQQPQLIHNTPSTMSQKDFIPGDLRITDQTLPQKKSAQPVLTSRNTITSGNAPKVIPEERNPSNMTTFLPETLSVSKKDILAKWASKQSHWSDSKTPKPLSASEETSIKQLAHNIDLHSNSLFSVSTTSRPPANLLNVPQTPSFKVSPSLEKARRKEQTTSSNNKVTQLVTQTTETKKIISEGVYTEASKISESPVLFVFALLLLVMLIFTLWKIWQYQMRKNDIWVAGFPLKEGTYESLLWTKKGTKRLEGLSIENECHEV